MREVKNGEKSRINATRKKTNIEDKREPLFLFTLKKKKKLPYNLTLVN